MGIITGKSQDTAVKWTIKDTEFLLRLINNSNIPGADIEQASGVVGKIKSIHTKLLNSKAE